MKKVSEAVICENFKRAAVARLAKMIAMEVTFDIELQI
jgi:hypothetical protein